MNYLIYDLEICKCIPDGVRFSEFEYCEGWRDFENMGISTCAYESLDGSISGGFFWEDLSARAEFIRLIDRFPLAGFNSASFDDQLLKANGVRVVTQLDILSEIRLSAYGSASYQDCPKGYSYKLDDVCSANGLKKTGHGALAPQWWQQGERQKVLDYCRNDAAIERAVLELLLQGTLVDPNTGKLLSKVSK